MLPPSTWKRVIFILFLTFFSSCSKPCLGWKLSTIHAVYPCSTYAKARLTPCNPFSELEAELLCNGKDTSFFLNALMLGFPPAETCEGKINVNVMIAEQSYEYASERLEGGQRIKLPEQAKQLIISTLLDGDSVIISIDRYQTVLIPDNFEKVYQELLKL